MEDVPELLATNGRMVRLLTKDVPGGMPPYESLHQTEEACTWKLTLEYAVYHGADALIDAGGFMAGAANREAAIYLLHLTTFDYTKYVASPEARIRG